MENINKLLEDHHLWVISKGEQGKQADLSGMDLMGINVKNLHLKGIIMSDANLSESNFNCVNLSGAKLNNTNLTGSQLNGVNLNNADLTGANLSGANLASALVEMGTKYLPQSGLIYTDLINADMTGANLAKAILASANLSGCKGLIDPNRYLEDNFEFVEEGIIVYKKFALTFISPLYWTIEAGSIIEEVVNYDRTARFGNGINVATKRAYEESIYRYNVWKCLIRWKWLAGVVVPYGTDGRIRCSKLELLEKLTPVWNENGAELMLP